MRTAWVTEQDEGTRQGGAPFLYVSPLRAQTRWKARWLPWGVGTWSQALGGKRRPHGARGPGAPAHTCSLDVRSPAVLVVSP